MKLNFWNTGMIYSQLSENEPLTLAYLVPTANSFGCQPRCYLVREPHLAARENLDLGNANNIPQPYAHSIPSSI